MKNSDIIKYQMQHTENLLKSLPSKPSDATASFAAQRQNMILRYYE